MRHLSLDQVQAFLDVTATGSFSAAAQRLNLTQPAISQQVRELERRLGVRLLDRLGKRAQPTAAGADFLVHGRALLAQAEAASSAMRRYREGRLGRVRLVTASAVASYLLPEVLRDLRKRHPTLEIVVHIDVTSRAVEAVVENQFDLGLVTLPVAESKILEVVFVREDPMMAVFPMGERDLPPRATPAYLAGRTLILNEAGTQLYRITREWFEAAGHVPRPAMQLGNSESIKALVAAGAGVAVLPIERTRDPLLVGRTTLRPLSPKLARRLALVMRRDKVPDPALAIVRKALLGLSQR